MEGNVREISLSMVSITLLDSAGDVGGEMGTYGWRVRVVAVGKADVVVVVVVVVVGVALLLFVVPIPKAFASTSDVSKGASKICAYIPGFFSTNAFAPDKCIHVTPRNFSGIPLRHRDLIFLRNDGIFDHFVSQEFNISNHFETRPSDIRIQSRFAASAAKAAADDEEDDMPADN